MTRQDKARPGKTRQEKTRLDKRKQEKTRQDKTRQDKTRQDKGKTRKHKKNIVGVWFLLGRTSRPGPKQDRTKQDKTRRDRQVKTRKARQVKTRHVIVPISSRSIPLSFPQARTVAWKLSRRFSQGFYTVTRQAYAWTVCAIEIYPITSTSFPIQHMKFRLHECLCRNHPKLSDQPLSQRGYGYGGTEKCTKYCRRLVSRAGHQSPPIHLGVLFLEDKTRGQEKSPRSNDDWFPVRGTSRHR